MAVASNALCTFEEVMDYGRLVDYKTQDNTLIENLIDRMTNTFHKICDVDQFLSKSYSQRYDGNGTTRLIPLNKYTPIISSTSLHDSITWDFDSDSLIASDDYIIVNNLYIQLKDTYFNKSDQNIRFISVCGYSSIPLDLKQACIEEVSRKFIRRKDFDVVAKAFGDGSVDYVEKDLLLQTRNILNRYKNRSIF